MYWNLHSLAASASTTAVEARASNAAEVASVSTTASEVFSSNVAPRSRNHCLRGSMINLAVSVILIITLNFKFQTVLHGI